MKRRILLAACAVLVALAAAIAAYFSGLFIPNYPSQSAFPVRGIDVSHHQGEIDWKAVPRDEVSFVYLKATEGGDFHDTRFQENWKQSAEAGFPRGAYHFFSLKTPGAAQAANFIATVPKDPLALPPAIDLEYHGNTSHRPTVEAFQKELTAFIEAIRNHYGREPIIYTATDFIDEYLGSYPLPRLWIRAVVTRPRLKPGHSWIFWQYSEKEKTPGIKGFVDQDVFYGTRGEFRAFAEEGQRK